MEDMPNRSAFIAFQGGGAKGICHVGGIRAVNALKLNIRGVSGTSAGAIVAALVAVGYSGDAIFSPEDRTHILQRVAGGKYANPTTLFTEKGWAAVVALGATAKRVAKIKAWLCCSGWKGVVRKGLVPAITIVGFCLLPRVTLFVLIAVVMVVFRKVHLLNRGLCSLSAVRDLVDCALAEKLGDPGAKDIKFRDLHEARCLPLKLVATNLTDGTLELFCFERTPEACVADAVAASIRLPIIFSTWEFAFARDDEAEVKSRAFLDGGIMSNLPMWTFDEERELNPEAMTIAFGLSAEDHGDQPERHWGLAALDAVIAGPALLHKRGISRLIHVELTPGIGLLDFALSFERLSKEVKQAEQDATEDLEREVFELPNLMQELLAAFRLDISRQLWDKYGDVPYPEGHMLFRLAIAIQKPVDRLSMTIAYESGHQKSQFGTKLAFASSLPGQAWSHRGEGKPQFSAFAHMKPSPDKVYEDSHWMAIVPLAINDSEEGMGDYSERAAVAILESPSELGSPLKVSKDALASFANDLHAFVVDWVQDVDLGRVVQRSESWL